MAVGKAKVKFIGGCLDGENTESFDTRAMKQRLVKFNGYWFGAKGDSVQILKGKYIGDNWLSYCVDVYEKEHKGNDGYFIYRFKSKDTIHRCTATTKKGLLCAHVAVRNTEYCPIHAKTELEETNCK